MNNCPLCGGDRRVAHPCVKDPVTGEGFAIVTCRTCGLGVTEPLPPDLGRYYPAAYYGGRHGATERFCLRRRLRWLGRASGRLLDIGCGDGAFLLAARERGWDVEGVERNTEPAARAGLRVAESLEAVGAPPERGGPRYDRITLWHSLEHIEEGPELIRRAAGRLKPDGRILIAVPDFGGWQARLFGATWLHADVPRHVHHYTRESLLRLCEKAGLRVGRTWHQEFEYDLLGWSQSALNRLFSEPNLFFNWLTRKPVRAAGFVKWAQIGIGLGLTAASVPLVWLAAVCGQGGTVIVEAER